MTKQQTNDSFDFELEETSAPQIQPAIKQEAVAPTVAAAVVPPSTEPMVVPDIGELSNSEILDIVIDKADLDKVFEIEKVEVLKPILINAQGQKVPTVKSQDGKKEYYKTKLKVTYKNSTYVSYIPNIKWYSQVDAGTGKVRLNPWFQTKISEDDLSSKFTPEISRLYFKVCKLLNKESGKVTPKEFVDTLIGKKVKLSQYKEKYNGEDTYRIDIKEFVQ